KEPDQRPATVLQFLAAFDGTAPLERLPRGRRPPPPPVGIGSAKDLAASLNADLDFRGGPTPPSTDTTGTSAMDASPLSFDPVTTAADGASRARRTAAGGTAELSWDDPGSAGPVSLELDIDRGVAGTVPPRRSTYR